MYNIHLCPREPDYTTLTWYRWFYIRLEMKFTTAVVETLRSYADYDLFFTSTGDYDLFFTSTGYYCYTDPRPISII